jgi:hypothetical protein
MIQKDWAVNPISIHKKRASTQKFLRFIHESTLVDIFRHPHMHAKRQLTLLNWQDHTNSRSFAFNTMKRKLSFMLFHYF